MTSADKQVAVSLPQSTGSLTEERAHIIGGNPAECWCNPRVEIVPAKKKKTGKAE